MRKIFSRKLLLVFSLFTAVSYSIIWACGWSDWDEYGVSAFAPEAFVDSAYKPFFYSDMFYYEIGHDDAHVGRFNDQIVAEWKEYLGVSNIDTAVAYFLLKARVGLIDSVTTQKQNALPENVASMAMVKDKSSKKIASFFKFLSYAKANESYAAISYEYWDYDENKMPKQLTEKEVSNRSRMEKEMNNSQDNFIAQRYFFQIVRGYFFGADYASCIYFYEKNKGKFPSNKLAVRCLSYVAGCYYKQKNYAQANYLYSKVYDAGPEFKTVAHFSFHPQEEADWKQTLALCQNKNEQITLWHLLGIYFDEERAVKEIYALDPKSEKLDLLLGRLINIQEIQSNTESTEYGGGNYRPGKDSLSKNALSLVSSIANAENTSKPYLWHISAGYLHFINQDFATAKAHYAKAEKTLPNTELAQAQIRLFKLMNNVASIKKTDNSTESLLLADLLWLQKISENQIPSFRYAYAYEWIKMKMSKQYKKQSDFIRSELFVHQDTFYTNPAMVANLKGFLLNKNLSSFDQYCKSIYTITVSDITEFQYEKLAYEDKIDEALDLYNKSDSATDGGELLGNPFNGNIKDCHDCDHAVPQKIKYTKIALLQKMKEMKDNAAAGKDVFSNNLLLGNAFYNMSHYGNARFFYECAVIGSGHYSPTAISNSFVKMLVNQNNARKYYQKALAAAANDEQKVKLTYLLLKCDRNEVYNKLYESGSLDGWSYGEIPNINFSNLLAYKNTKYYGEIIGECSYFYNYTITKK